MSVPAPPDGANSLWHGTAHQCPEMRLDGGRCKRYRWFDLHILRTRARLDWRCHQHRNGHVLTDAEARQVIDAGTKPGELLLLVDPGLDQAAADYLLWNATPFPMIQGVHDLVDWLAENGLSEDEPS